MPGAEAESPAARAARQRACRGPRKPRLGRGVGAPVQKRAII